MVFKLFTWPPGSTSCADGPSSSVESAERSCPRAKSISSLVGAVVFHFVSQYNLLTSSELLVWTVLWILVSCRVPWTLSHPDYTQWRFLLLCAARVRIPASTISEHTLTLHQSHERQWQPRRVLIPAQIQSKRSMTKISMLWHSKTPLKQNWWGKLIFESCLVFACYICWLSWIGELWNLVCIHNRALVDYSPETIANINACSVNIANAAVFNLKKELHLTAGQRYNNCLVIFFIPYILFEIPSNLLLKRFKPNVWCMSLYLYSFTRHLRSNLSQCLAACSSSASSPSFKVLCRATLAS